MFESYAQIKKGPVFLMHSVYAFVQQNKLQRVYWYMFILL